VKFAIFSHFVLQTGDWYPNTRLGRQFPMRNTKGLKNGKLRKAILSAFYNISQRNFVILIILWCSFKLWWNFYLDQNFSYKGKGPLHEIFSAHTEKNWRIYPFDSFQSSIQHACILQNTNNNNNDLLVPNI
jgi:hypothetical protein